ncbi:MAG: sterol desaturase family protein [Bacteroidia bacterium]|nr:sterol desaturase family protein [Bacteroidia bacterium]
MDFENIQSFQLDPGFWGGVYTFFRLTARYFLFSGTAFLLFYVFKKRDWLYLKIQEKWPTAKNIKTEIKYSVLSIAIFALLKTLLIWAYVRGYTQLTMDFSEIGWPGFTLGTIGLIFLHDTWFYWTHRLMHHPRIFKHVHKVHHLSHNPTPWAAFSFHPVEAIFEFGFLPLAVFLFPMHISTIIIVGLYQMTFNVIGHLGYELFPSGFTRGHFTKWLNTSTHHNMHHKLYQCNYGLYFNIWDRIMGTNHKKYEETFEQIKEKQARYLEAKKNEPETEVGNLEGITPRQT